MNVEINEIGGGHWDEVLEGFADANIYQTSAWGASSGGALERIVVNDYGRILAGAQARIVRAPFLKVGIAYVRWGPVWKPRVGPANSEALRLLLEAMQREFAERQRLFLRIFPREADAPTSSVGELLHSLGYRAGVQSASTLYLPLDQSPEDLRRNLSQNWRKNLKHAERSDLSVVSATDGSLFDSMERLVRELHTRKRDVARVDIDLYRDVQARLPAWAKLNVMVCSQNGVPVAGLIGSAIGDIGVELVAATGDAGLRSRGSYLLRWRMCLWLKQSGCSFYDLNGVNPGANPGGYQFKAGLSGKRGVDVCYSPAHDYCASPASRFVVRLNDRGHALATVAVKRAIRRVYGGRGTPRRHSATQRDDSI